MTVLPFIVFDMDGTLLDTRLDIARAANLARADLDLPAMSVADVVSAVGDGVNLFVSRVTYPEGHPRFFEARKIFLKHYAIHAVGDTQPYPGIVALLSNLKHAGYRMGVVSNKPKVLVDQLIKHFEWKHYFEVCLGGDSANRPKPAAEPIWMALEQSGLPQDYPVVVIGDGVQDVMVAAAMGAKCLWCSWGFNEYPPKDLPSIRVDLASDVLERLRELYATKSS